MAWLLNVILPGTGLIIRRREWLGLSLAMVFSISVQVAIAGSLIAPETVPFWLVRLAAALGAVSWFLSQYLCYRQGLILSRIQRGLSNLVSEARAAMEGRDFVAAERAVDSGLALNDEDVELHVLKARLFAHQGNSQAARKEWRRVVKLDHDKRFLDEARNAVRRESQA